MNNFSDPEGGIFYSRCVIAADSIEEKLAIFIDSLTRLKNDFGLDYKLSSNERKPLVILASKETHCLNDILYRSQNGLLNCEVKAIIGNHEHLADTASRFHTPFIHHPINDDADTRSIFDKVALFEPDTIVLARYMRIVPPDVCSLYNGAIINIHHSFLPSFVGSNPYQQAYRKGVKLIGATCHYVTPDLDQGPIIEQDVVRVSHAHTKEALVELGKDVEISALSKGLKYHLDDRVLVEGNRTIIFN